MTIGKAAGVVSDIWEAPFTQEEKLEAIRIVSEMKFHEFQTTVKKESAQQVIKWLLNVMGEEKDA